MVRQVGQPGRRHDDRYAPRAIVLEHERLDEPAAIAFVNRGVFLTLADSPVLDALQQLAAGGSRMLSCGTCLDYFGVRDRLAVGEVGSIPVLQELMIAADKVITL
jgi:Ni,Fe-hydrogenase I small subunit